MTEDASMNTMKELKEEVQTRMRHLDGRYIESMSTVSVEEMLGVIDMDEEYHPDKVTGTILDLDHEFWDDYVRDIRSERSIREEVEVAVRLLRDEGKFRVIEPEDEELQGASLQVDPVFGVDWATSDDFDLAIKEVNSGQLLLRVRTESGIYETTLTKV